MSLKDRLWVAKYAPTTFKETLMPKYIKDKMLDYIETKDIPNLLFAGPAGTGKTTSGKVLLEALKVEDEDLLFINASDINSVDDVRNIIRPFAMSMSSNEDLPVKFIFLDEADHLSGAAQAALRNLIEASYDSARFILTANYPKKIIPALHSRVQSFTLEKPNINGIAERVLTILDNEHVVVENEDDLLMLIKNNSTDIRKLIQLLQQNTTISNGKNVLRVNVKSDEGTVVFNDYLTLFKKGDAKALRNLVYSKFTDTDTNDFWTLLLDDLIKNSEKYEELGSGIDNIIYQLNEGQRTHEMVSNKVLNVIGFTLAALIEEE